MQASSFDFDVVTGPSTPREEREDASPKDQSQSQPADTKPATPRTR
jgi:hypothetical protein